MGLLSFFHNRSMATNASAEAPADVVQRARAQARRRLIGAVVLVGIGIVGFPLLFETQPRPIPVDLPIIIPNKDTVPPLAPPAPQATPPQATAPQAPAKSRDEAQAEPRTPAPREAATTPAEPRAASPQPAEAKAPARSNAEAERARALLEGKATARADAPSASERMVVQVGAFSDPAAARGVRQRVEQIGLKTFVQEVQTDGGKRLRVRVGPFDSREDAEKAAARIKAAGLDAAVMTP
jgi:DedD protein